MLLLVILESIASNLYSNLLEELRISLSIFPMKVKKMAIDMFQTVI